MAFDGVPDLVVLQVVVVVGDDVAEADDVPVAAYSSRGCRVMPEEAGHRLADNLEGAFDSEAEDEVLLVVLAHLARREFRESPGGLLDVIEEFLRSQFHG